MQDSYKNMILSIVAGVLASALFALVSKASGLSIIGFAASPIPVAVAGLAFGYAGLITACVAAMVGFSAISGVSGIVLYAMWDIIPVAVLTGLLLKNRKNENGEIVWYPVGYALSWTSIVTAMTGILITITMLFFYSVAADLQQSAAENAEEAALIASQDFFSKVNLQETMLKFLNETAAPSLSAKFPNYESFLQNMAMIFTALVATAWFCRIVLVVWLSEYILAKKEKSVRPNPEYVPLYVQNWLLVLIVIAGATAELSTSENIAYLAANFAFSVSLPFCLLGLSQVHIWARTVPYTKAILTAFYILLSLPLFFGYGMKEAVGILAVIGLYEQLVRIYGRYIRPLKNGEK